MPVALCWAFVLLFLLLLLLVFWNREQILPLSFFTVITAGLTQQSSVKSVALSKDPFVTSRLRSCGTWS